MPLYPRVILLESERQTMDQIRDNIEANGFECEVLLALEGIAGILEERRVDLVLISWLWKSPTALHMAKEIKELKPDLPIILYNGSTAKTHAKSTKRAGVYAFLPTPLDIGALLETMRAALKEQKD